MILLIVNDSTTLLITSEEIVLSIVKAMALLGILGLVAGSALTLLYNILKNIMANNSEVTHLVLEAQRQLNLIAIVIGILVIITIIDQYRINSLKSNNAE